MSRYALIVPDSSPLITLAAAGALDVLLKPGLPVLVPDGVHWEVTRFTNLQGAAEIVEWMASNTRQVFLRATQEFLNRQNLIAAGAKRIRTWARTALARSSTARRKPIRLPVPSSFTKTAT